MVLACSGTFRRFYDNGHYVGHDEPSVKFISALPGSGNTMNYAMRLPRDPAQAADRFRGTRTDYAELSLAPWFGLPMCDPHSYPQNPCTPDSDTNSGALTSPGAAGSAFMELQFYPPGFAPFIDNESCSRWRSGCAALTIDRRRVHLQLRVLQHQLRGAGQLLLPADQRHPAGLARAAGPEHQDDARQCW